MPFYVYGQKEIDYLKKKDKKLGTYIDSVGMIEREITPDLFTALTESIISQQISSKAAATICGRLSGICDMTPKGIMSLELDQIQKCGMSVRKAQYIKNVAEATATGVLDLERLNTMPDDDIIKTLSGIKGVGVWTAEMMLIFSLMRPDVVSYGDLAIRRGMMNLYRLNELPKDIFLKYKKRYSPYGTVASLYLWDISVRQL